MTYREALDALRAACPNHPLLRVFSMQEGAAMRVLIDIELKKNAPDTATQPPIGAAVDENPDDSEDEYLKNLRRQQSDLFCDRRKLSNQFHGCASDAQRARVSEDIQIVQRKIEFVRRQINDYKNGAAPGVDEKYPVPQDPFRVILLRQSLRSSISRKSKENRELGDLAARDAPGADKALEKGEAKMRELQNHLNRVEKAIKDRNIQPGRLREG